MNILILGTSGYLGKSVYFYLKKNLSHKIIGTGLTKKKFDLTNLKNLKKIISKKKPKLIINCSGLTDIDKCEKYKKKSKNININLIKNIFLVKKSYNLSFQLIHFSTDQIYNPKKNIKNKESNHFKPMNIYSRHKLKAENICIKNYGIVFRTNLIGRSISNKISFTDWIYKKIKNKDKIKGFVDSYYSPLSLITISKILKKIIVKKLYNKYGVYNLGSSDGISKYKLIIKFLKKIDIFERGLIEKARINDICITTRTNYNRLNVNKFTREFKINLPKVDRELNKISKSYE